MCLSSQVRVVRLVAVVALGAAGMFRGHDLREPTGFGRVLLMAAAAEIGHVRKFGNDGWVVGMRRLRSVTGLARDVGVLTGFAGVDLFVMAHGAGYLAGVRNGVLADKIERGWPVVAVPAEILGHHCGADQQKDTHGGQ